MSANAETDRSLVIARFRWGRMFGYQMLASTGFPRTIGGRYRLDTLIAWEDRVLFGVLTGRPDTGCTDPLLG